MQNEINAQKMRLSTLENNNDPVNKEKLVKEVAADQMAAENEQTESDLNDIQEKNQKFQSQINQLKQENLE